MAWSFSSQASFGSLRQPQPLRHLRLIRYRASSVLSLHISIGISMQPESSSHSSSRYDMCILRSQMRIRARTMTYLFVMRASKVVAIHTILLLRFVTIRLIYEMFLYFQGFFRRSIQQKIQYRPCTKNQQCAILRINRNRCQYCRLKKCISAGMSRDGE